MASVPRPSQPPAPAGDLPLGKDQLNDLLWEAATYVEAMGEAALAGTPLTLPSSGMLIMILGEPGITVSEIARQLPKTQQAISQVVARLEKLGYVERRLGAGRGVELHLTDAGRAIAQDGLARELELQDRLRDVLGADRYEALRELLLEARPLLRGER